jgi:hypothetical protein
MGDYETLIDKGNIFFQKNKHINNEYRIISSCSLTKSTNIINIVQNNQLFELIARLNSDFILEYNNENGIITYVFSSDLMREFGDKFVLKFSNNVNIISHSDCIISGSSVHYNNGNYSNIFHLNSLQIVFNISNNSFNINISYNIDNNLFNHKEILLVSNFLIKVVSNLNLYVCN